MHFIPSERGGQKLAFQGFIYVKDRSYDTYSTWRCERSRWTQGKCLGRAKLMNGQVEVTKEHHQSHLPNLVYVQAQVAKANLYSLATQSTSSSRNLVTDSMQGLSQATVAHLPSMSSMASTITKKRGRLQAPLPNPLSLDQIEIPDELTLTLQNELFLLHDSGSLDTERIFVFATQRNLKVLNKCDTWSADGTFKACPSLFNQLWVIHGYYRGAFIPLVYALMPVRNTACYERVLQTLIDNGLGGPITLIQDFELAELNAFKNKFPPISVKGCWFHFSQCLYRKVQELGSSTEYASNEEFHNSIKLFMALPFVKREDVVQYYEAASVILNDISSVEFADDFLNYMESTWVGVPTRGRRRNPRFVIDVWNLHASVIDDTPRTNNASEGWHNAFHASIGSNHPTIFKFLNAIKSEQSRSEAQVVKLDAGDVPKVSKKYEAINARISNVVEQYDTYEPIEFLTAVSHNFYV